MNEKFDELMREIRQSRHEVEEKLSTSIAELKSEVNSTQQKILQHLAKKISNSSYQFNERLMSTSTISSPLLKRWCAPPMKNSESQSQMALEEKATLKRAEKLQEGTKALTEQQKHMKVADWSKLGWTNVNYYRDGPLASDSEDEKSLNRAEKVAKRDAERITHSVLL